MTKRYYPTVRMPNPCPACSCKTGKHTQATGVFTCTECGGTVGTCYRGEALALVEFDKPMTETRPCPTCGGTSVVGMEDAACSDCEATGRKKIPSSDYRYFDFTFLDPDIRFAKRIHGWFDRVSLQVVQYG